MYRQPSSTFSDIYHANAVIMSASECTEKTGDTDHAGGNVHCRIIEPIHHVDLEIITLQNQTSALNDSTLQGNIYLLGSNQWPWEGSFGKYSPEGCQVNAAWTANTAHDRG